VTHSRRQQKPGSQVGTTKSAYDARRARVDEAHLRMQQISSRPHAPADARQAAAELDEALRDATVAAVAALRSAEPIESRPRVGLRRGKATRAMAPLVRLWSVELLRLSEIAVWLRRTTLDDPGVHLPATVRVADYAAIGPHIAGVGFDNDPAVSYRVPRIGVALEEVIDGVSRQPSPVQPSDAAPSPAEPRAPKAA
jgi:hypothetical protein